MTARTVTAYVAGSTKPLYLILLDDGVTFEEADSHPPEFVAFPAADCQHAAAAALEALLPRHDVTFTLEHNPHRVYYETIEQHEANRGDARDWSDPEDFQRAVDADEMWVAHWYPDTSVGSYRVCASSLSRLLEQIAEVTE